MTNIIRSDIYRLQKGRTVRNSLLGLLVLILFIGVTFFVLSSDSLSYLLESGTAVAEEFSSELSGIEEALPANAAEFTKSVIADNVLTFFILPFIITIFCADFSFGTHRNTLSYESNRRKVFIGKLLLTILCCLLLNVFLIAASILTGGIFLSFQGLSAAAVTDMLVITLLLFPSQLAAICFGYCLAACTKKSSSVIAAYLLVLIMISVIIQLLSLFPPLRWVTYLDWNMVGKELLHYRSLPAVNLLMAVAVPLIVAAITSFLGLSRYCSKDMA